MPCSKTRIYAACAAVVFALSLLPSVADAASFRSGQARLKKDVATLREIREHQVVLQEWDFTCGAAALATVLQHQYGRDYSEPVIVETLLRATGKDLEIVLSDGFSLLDLKIFANAAGFRVDAYGQLTLDDLRAFGLPAIVPVNLYDFHHFVVFREAHAGYVFLADPAIGNVILAEADFEAAWQEGIGFFVIDPAAQDPDNALSVKERELMFAGKRQTLARLNRVTRTFMRRSTAQRVKTAIAPRPVRPRFGSLPFDGLDFLDSSR